MISDYIKSALKNIQRNKKHSILIIIFSCLIFLLFIDMCIFKNFFDFYENMYKKSILAHTLLVDNIELSSEEATEELKDIDHVIDVYDSAYEVLGIKSNLNDNDLNGEITLKYGIKKMVPKSIVGKNADELLPGEVVCPSEFYPANANFFDIDESKFLTKKQTLNREVVLTYQKHIPGIPEDENFENKEIYNKTVKIVGLYDVNNYREDINICYIGMNDMREIRNKILPVQRDGAMLHVIVDSKKNINEVRKRIQDKGAYRVETISIFDYAFIGTLFTMIIIVAIVIVLSILFIIKNYLNKKIKNEVKYIGILRACGYSKKQIIIKEIIENSLVLLISSIISIALFSTLFTILDKHILRYFKYIGFNIKINILFLLMTFILVLFFAEYINYKLINKKIDAPISDILKEE